MALAHEPTPRRRWRINIRPAEDPREEFCDAAGFEKLKARIEAYWAERGAHVKIHAVDQSFVSSMRMARTDLRSDMKNGLPKDWKEK